MVIAFSNIIGIQTTHNMIQGVRLHLAPEPAYCGQILAHCYTNPVKIRKLITQGDIEILGTSTRTMTHEEYRALQDDPWTHGMPTACANRDTFGGGLSSQPFTCANKLMFARHSTGYAYLWTHRHWECLLPESADWVPLSQVLGESYE